MEIVFFVGNEFIQSHLWQIHPSHLPQVRMFQLLPSHNLLVTMVEFLNNQKENMNSLILDFASLHLKGKILAKCFENRILSHPGQNVKARACF